MILSRVSRAFEDAVRILRRISESAGLALSEISSSLMIAVVILSSRYLFETSPLKYPSRAVSTDAQRLCHSLTVRITCIVRATESSSPVVRQPPASARRRLPPQFTAPPKEGAPNLPLRATASSVCLSSSSTRLRTNCGSRLSAACFASSSVVMAANLSSILSSSSVL